MLTLRDLGGLTLEDDHGTPVSGAGSQPARLAVLAVLARCGPGGISRDRLLALLWPERDATHARGALNQALYAIRQATGVPDLVAGTTTLRLEPGGLTSESVEFERLLDAGQGAAAIASYRGPYLDGVHLSGSPEFDEWAEAERQRLAARHREALRRLAREASAAGELDDGVRWWRALVQAAPHDTEATIGLVETLAAQGDRAGAMLAASEHEMRLRRELGLGPDPRLTELVTAIRTEGFTSHRSPPWGARPPLETAPPGSGVATPAPAQPPPSTSAPRRRPAPLTIGLALVAVASVAAVLTRRDRTGIEIGKAVQLTREEGLEIDPTLSPDGTVIAYAAGPLNRMRVYVRQRSGRALPVTIDSGGTQSHPVWSPDGDWLLLIWGGPQGALVEVPALGGPARIIVGDSVLAAAWSPDGKEIAYSRGGAVRVIPRQGGTSRELASVPSIPEPSDLSWSPDGRLVAFAAGNAMYGAVSGPDFGNRGPSRIYVVPAAGGTPVEAVADGSLNVSPTWAPAGHTLLFVSDRDGPRDIYLQELTSSGRPAGAARRLTVGLGAHTISLSADGKYLAWSAFRQSANIWALPVDSSGGSGDRATPVTDGNQLIEGLSISPDGRRLYFDADRDGNADLYRLTLPAGDPEQLTRDPADEFWPVESPDGQWIAFHSTRFGQREIMVMPSSGGAAVRVTDEDGEAMMPAWSPDGEQLAFALLNAGERSGIYLVNRTAGGAWGTPRRLSTVAAGSPWCAHDEAPLAVLEPGRGPANAVLERATVEIPAGGTTQFEPSGGACAPDGSFLVYKSHDPGDAASFWLRPRQDRVARRVGRIPGGTLSSPRSDVATDGQRIYFLRYERQSDLYRAPLTGLAR